MQHHLRQSGRAAGRALTATALLAAALWIGGCGRPLISPLQDRTQYDEYDTVRHQKAPAYLEDEFGRRTPNLRGRLRSKD